MHPEGCGLKLDVQYVKLFPAGYSEYLPPTTPSPPLDLSMHSDWGLETGGWRLLRYHVHVVAQKRQRFSDLASEIPNTTLIWRVLAGDQPNPHPVPRLQSL
jgi:hypothetical protein